MNSNTINKRITSIDALRAFTLLGILLVHARLGFGWGGVKSVYIFDYTLKWIIKYLLEGRCMLIFNVLFGVSFFIILSKGNYPPLKFVRRCILLSILGLINKYFYNNDVLLIYGICGMALVCIRHLSNKKIIGLIGTLIVVGFVLKYLG